MRNLRPQIKSIKKDLNDQDYFLKIQLRREHLQKLTFDSEASKNLYNQSMKLPPIDRALQLTNFEKLTEEISPRKKVDFRVADLVTEKTLNDEL